MNKTLRSWRRSLRYRSTVRKLKALPAQQLSALGIRPSDINHLAHEVSGL